MSEWISVKDRKPPDGWMIFAYTYYADPKILQVDFGLHVDGIFTTSGIQRNVTHWALLPKVP